MLGRWKKERDNLFNLGTCTTFEIAFNQMVWEDVQTWQMGHPLAMVQDQLPMLPQDH